MSTKKPTNPTARLKVLTAEEIIQRLIWLRQARGLELTEVAEKIGCSRQQLWNMESGKISRLSIDLIQSMCVVYGVSLAQFFAGMDPLSRLHPKAVETALLIDAVFRRGIAAAERKQT